MSDHRGDPAVHVFQQIAAALRSRILLGELVAGDELPSQAELAAEFSVATLTARAALQVLREEGLIVSQRGRRSYVADRQPAPPPTGAGTPLVRVHRDQPVVAIKWPQCDRWLMARPPEPAGQADPAATAEWALTTAEPDLDGDDWIDPAAALGADVRAYTGRLRQQLAVASRQLSAVRESLDDLERHARTAGRDRAPGARIGDDAG
jgi:DNA-binding transcriptional MocR family regulator